MDEYIDVISSFYEYKDIILNKLTTKVIRKFDTCFKKFHNALEKESDGANDQDGEPPMDKLKLKCFETIREETIHGLTALIDDMLMLAVKKFLNDNVKEIKCLGDKLFQENLIEPTTEASQAADEEFKAELSAICTDMERRVQAKELQLQDVEGQLRSVLSKNKADQVILLKQYRKFIDGFKD